MLTTDDLVAGEDVFVAATGVTTGSLLRGVRYLPNGAVTDSIVMRNSCFLSWLVVLSALQIAGKSWANSAMAFRM